MVPLVPLNHVMLIKVGLSPVTPFQTSAHLTNKFHLAGKIIDHVLDHEQVDARSFLVDAVELQVDQLHVRVLERVLRYFVRLELQIQRNCVEV